MIFDADSHVMEVEDWLGGYAEPGVRERLGTLGLDKAGKGAAQLFSSLPELWELQRNEQISAEVISGPKGWKAPGALDPQVRSRVLDALGIDAQLVFPTFALGQFARSADPDVRYGGTRALNRAMAEFCATDDRLLAVGYLPLNIPSRAIEELNAALELGVTAVWLSSEAPGDFSPAHVDLEPVWARLAEAGGAVRASRRRRQAAAQGVPRERPSASRRLARWRRKPPGQGLPCAASITGAVPRMPGSRRRLPTSPAAARRGDRARRELGPGDAPKPRSRAPIVLEV